MEALRGEALWGEALWGEGRGKESHGGGSYCPGTSCSVNESAEQSEIVKSVPSRRDPYVCSWKIRVIVYASILLY